MKPADILEQSERIAVKIGSNLIVDPATGGVRTDWLEKLVCDINALLDTNKEILLISSGAIALGREALGIKPTIPSTEIKLDLRQSAAAVGQFVLFSAYHTAFSAHGITAAQILLTTAETEDRRNHLNARGTLSALMERKIVPIINENDTISTEHIRFGDNDALAARVSQMIEADCLLLLSTADGLYSADPNLDPNAVHYPFLPKIERHHLEEAGDPLPGTSTGGMKSKMYSARAASRTGAHVIIASGKQDYPITKMGKSTVIAAQDSRENARKRWILSHVNPAGTLVIDEGAENALHDGRSLLPVGVVACEGDFERGDAVRIVSKKTGLDLAVGLSNYGSKDAVQIIGHHSRDIIIRLGFAGRDTIVARENLVLHSPDDHAKT